MGRLRVLFVTPFYEPAWALGGMARASAGWASALVDQGVEVEVFTTTADANGELDVPPGVPLNRDGVTVTYFPRFRWSGNRYISLPLLDACRKKIRTFDIVHSIGLWTFPSFGSSQIASFAKVPYLVSLHGTLMDWAYGHHRMRKWLFMRIMEKRRIAMADAVICSSEMEKRHFEALGISGRVAVIPNIVRSIDIVAQVSRNRFRKRHSLEDALVLLFAGRLVRNKGVHLTIEAFAMVAKQFPQARLVIVGPMEDDSGHLAKQQAQGLNLSDRVKFLGGLSGDAYWDAVAGADLFVLNSYSENFGMAPAEALSLGVPVLLSDQVGIADLVAQYRAGMVTPLKVEAIAAAMQLMLSNQMALSEMGRNGVRLVQDNFSASVVGKRFARLLEDVVRERQN